jgi:hypothetical protein
MTDFLVLFNSLIFSIFIQDFSKIDHFESDIQIILAHLSINKDAIVNQAFQAH